MPPKANVAGQTFTCLLALTPAGRSDKGEHLWECLCVCGQTVFTTVGKLRSGNTKSCGCYHRQRAKYANVTHGQKKTREYRIWLGIRNRCNNPKSLSFQNYGSRGIKICEEWNDFSVFMRDMGKAPTPKHSVDRIDVNGNYEPSNCRWLLQKEQCRNTRKNVRYEHNGKMLCLSELAEVTGLSAGYFSKLHQTGKLESKLEELSHAA